MPISRALTIGELCTRSGVPHSALRYYEEQGLIHSQRAASGHRRYPRETLRRVSFVRAAQELGLSLKEVRAALDTLPQRRTPDERDWTRLAASWRPRLDAQIRRLERLRDRLDGCIGCGCLSLRHCRLLNPGDAVSIRGPGPRYVIDEEGPAIGEDK